VEVSEPQVTPTEEGLEVSLSIREGRRFHVGAIQVAGDESADPAEALEGLSLKEGEVFNRSFLTNDVEAIEARYTDRGFFDAKVDPLTRLDEESLKVDVTFQVEKGTLYFLREIDIAGNTTTVDPVVRREIQVVEGQLWSAREIRVSQDRVRGLGFFEDVTFEPAQTDAPGVLDLGVKVVEKPTGSLSFGAGYSSQDQFVLSGSVAQSNLFGRGYGVSAAADIGGRADRFYLNFTDPYFLGSTFSLSSQIFNTDIEYPDFSQEEQGIEFTLGHALDEENRSRGYLRYGFSSRDIDEDTGVNAAATIFRELLSEDETTSLLGLAFSSDTRDDRIAPTRGRILGASVEGAGLGGFSRFARLEGRVAFFLRPPGWFPSWFPFRDKSTFLLGARAGYALPFNDVSDYDLGDLQLEGACFGDEICGLDQIDDDLELPLSERYFLGGLGTYQLRGFEGRSVGPRRAVVYDSGGIGGAFAANGPFSAVGRAGPGGVFVTLPDGTTGFVPPGECADTRDAFPNPQGDGDGECNSLEDDHVDDFDDLDETDVIGGNQFLSTTVEYRFPIAESLGLVGILFVDAGNAFAEDESLLDVGLWRYGSGFGVQWFSPFGPLQAFVGFPLDKLEVEDGVVFEFSVGGATF
jgi:outer membrane protein insertion porin family